MEGNLQTRGKQVKEPAAEESNEQYLERIFQQEPYMAQQPGFREFLLESMDEIGARPRASECASMLRAWKAGYEFRGPLLDIARTAWAVATGTESPRALPFTYSDDIGQIGEHDVFFGGVELTQDVGEFKAGHKFDGAVIDFQAGHLTVSTSAGREYRYNFALKVGAKHEGHTCTGCGSVVGQPCRQHA